MTRTPALLLFLLIPAHTVYLTGFTRQSLTQKLFVLRDLHTCIRDTRVGSLATGFQRHFICINGLLSRCIFRKYPRVIASETAGGQYCGSFMMTGRKDVGTRLKTFINVLKGHIILNEVLICNFLMIRGFTCADHGVGLVYEGIANVKYFCGRRVPWTLVIPYEHAVLHIMITAHMGYELSLFYSSVRKGWMKQLVSVKMVVSKWLSGIIAYSSEKEVNSVNMINYHVSMHVYHFINLRVTSSDFINGFVVVHDGPGPLSNILLDLNNTYIPASLLIQTTAYWAFVNIFMRNNNGTVIKVRMEFHENLGKAPRCSRGGEMRFQEMSSFKKNAVCFDYFRVATQFIAITVEQFVFQGPNQFSGISSIRCQYGGFTTHFKSGGKKIEFCKDITNLTINSENNYIYMSVVWFSGYSQGFISGNITSIDCNSFYIELYPPHQLYQDHAFVKINTSAITCFSVICPPMQTHKQRLCTIQLGPPPLGPTTLITATHNTLEPCNIHFQNSNFKSVQSYEIESLSTMNWPFGVINNTYTSRRYDKSQRSIYPFRFLQMANITFPLGCDRDSPWQQMSLSVRVSACLERSFRLVNMVANNIPLLSNNCLKFTYTFVAAKKHTTNYQSYHTFIYKDTGKITEGHDVLARYVSCPIVCRNYKYSVFVRDTDEKTIIKLTSPVGRTIFTGFYHRGFLVSIIYPDKNCQIQLCILSVHIDKPFYPIGTDNYNEEVQSPRYGDVFKFYNKRYETQILIHNSVKL